MPDTLSPPVRPFAWLDPVAGAIKARQHWGLFLGAALQLTLLTAMIVMRLWTHLAGDVYLVRVQPVDPRDFFRGDFVILSYEFSSVPPDRIEGLPRAPQDFRELEGREVFVSLALAGDGKHWQAVRFSIEPPEVGPYLRGRLIGFGRVEYGIESFFVQEGRGHVYEDAVRSGRLSAEISITPSGDAALRKLHINR